MCACQTVTTRMFTVMLSLQTARRPLRKFSFLSNIWQNGTFQEVITIQRKTSQNGNCCYLKAAKFLLQVSWNMSLGRQGSI